MTNRLRTEGTDAPAGGRPARSGVKALRRPELRRLAVRAHGRSGKDRGGPARPPRRPTRCPWHARRDPTPRGRRDRPRAGPRASRSATAASTVRARASSRGGDQAEPDHQAQVAGSSATAAACGRSSRSRTQPQRPSEAIEHGEPVASTTSSTTSPCLCASGCPPWRSRPARKPMRPLPRWLGRLAAGEAAVVMMTEVRGASNAKAKRELGWQPRYPTYRVGFPAVLGGESAADHGSPGSPAATSGSPAAATRPSKHRTTVWPLPRRYTTSPAAREPSRTTPTARAAGGSARARTSASPRSPPRSAPSA